MKRTLQHLGRAILATALAMTALTARADVESTDPVKLTIHDWTGQYLTTTLMGEILKEAGYNIEYVQADYIAQFAGLESGDLHIAMEMWETTGKQAMDESLATGKTVDLGETGMDAKEEWWYPMYMKEKMSGSTQLGGAERLRRGFFNSGDRTQGPVSRWPRHLGGIRR